MTLRSTSHETPWSDHAEYRPVSIGGCVTSPVTESDVKRVVGHDGGSDFGRSEIAVVELSDGRFVGWESWRDCTGSGFHSDAYGGNVEVWFAQSLDELKPLYSEQAWEAMGIK